MGPLPGSPGQIVWALAPLGSCVQLAPPIQVRLRVHQGSSALQEPAYARTAPPDDLLQAVSQSPAAAAQQGTSVQRAHQARHRCGTGLCSVTFVGVLLLLDTECLPGRHKCLWLCVSCRLCAPRERGRPQAPACVPAAPLANSADRRPPPVKLRAQGHALRASCARQGRRTAP